jgi:hypothetical protein
LTHCGRTDLSSAGVRLRVKFDSNVTACGTCVMFTSAIPTRRRLSVVPRYTISESNVTAEWVSRHDEWNHGDHHSLRETHSAITLLSEIVYRGTTDRRLLVGMALVNITQVPHAVTLESNLTLRRTPAELKSVLPQ